MDGERRREKGMWEVTLKEETEEEGREEFEGERRGGEELHLIDGIEGINYERVKGKR